MPLLHNQTATVSRRSALAGVGASFAAVAGAQAVAEEAAIWRHDYWAEKTRGSATIKLAMYRKRVGAPRPGAKPLPVLFLVHGSSIAALASWDLNVPGHGEYSTMNVFARQGYDVWTMDHEGYGKSDRTDGNSDIASGVADLTAAMAVIAHETGQATVSFLGQIVWRATGRGVRDGGAAAHRSVGAERVDLYRQGFADARQARRAACVLPVAQSPSA